MAPLKCPSAYGLKCAILMEPDTPPTLGPVTINPPLSVTISRQRTQNIPGTWAPGLYYYIGYCAMTYGGTIIDSSYFTFTKSAVSDGGPFVQDAICSGELFPGEVAVNALPTAFSLSEARPNPFNPTTVASFELQVASHVSLKVYDMAGRLVETLVNGWQEAGTHQVTFNGSTLSSACTLFRCRRGNSRR